MTGTLDATVLSPPETVAASRAGLTILANLGDLRASFPQTLIMLRRSFLANKRETVKRFLRAYSEAIYEFKTNKERIKFMLTALSKDQTILDETLAFYGQIFLSAASRSRRDQQRARTCAPRRRTQGDINSRSLSMRA
jgi:ABC-type nitrate/sulfonate/bicarbonate transport system substrate-binding protein